MKNWKQRTSSLRAVFGIITIMAIIGFSMAALSLTGCGGGGGGGGGGTAPTITTESLQDGVVGTAYSQTLAATGGTPITWSLESGVLPGGLSLSAAGVISGTPTTKNPFNFTVKATNATGSDTKEFSIYIADALTITTESLPNGTVGTAYSQTLASTYYSAEWSLESGALPGGLSLSTAGVISGTPTTEGTFNFTVKVTYETKIDTKELSIVIVNPPTITTASLPSGTVGTEYSQTITATGGTPITWSLESGVLPDGLSLSAAGVISGTPTTKNPFNFTVKATNATGSDTKEFSIYIASIGETYNVGDTGPGGGKIFYYSAEGFTMTDNNQVCHYLEAAPNNMDTTLRWASSSGYYNLWIDGTENEIGTGRKNTALILATDAGAPAAKACKDYRGPNNLTDWFLPNIDELFQLYYAKTSVGNMGAGRYWSSSQIYVTSLYGSASYIMFGYSYGYNSKGSNDAKNLEHEVRAVRAF